MTVLDQIAAASSPFPLADLTTPRIPQDGKFIPTPRTCKKVFHEGKCAEFYRSVATSNGRRECPYGFSVWPYQFGETRIAVTGLIGSPRLNSGQERIRAKEYPRNHVAADAVEHWASTMAGVLSAGNLARDREFSRRLDALHEIRKFNSIVKTNMERICTRQSPSDPDEADPDMVRALRASSLISVQLDALDILANAGTSAAMSNPRKWVFYRTVDKIVRLYRVLADSRGVKLRLSGSSNATARVDERTIHIIPSCLVDNAIKYSPRDGIIDVSVTDETVDGRPVIVLRVRSEGPPATAEEEGVLFVARGRGQAARATAEGSGVGLAIAHMVASGHGATIDAKQRKVSSSLSEWVFRVVLPVG